MAAKKKPAKRTRRGRPRRIDWARAEQLYVTSLRMTYAEVAQEVGAHPDTVGRRAASGGWTKKRAEQRARNVQRSLERAMDDHLEGVAALRELEYQESLSIISTLQAARRQATKQVDRDGVTIVRWSPSQIRAYTQAFREAAAIGRLALGLPTEIKADPNQTEETYENAVRRARARREGDEWPEGI